MATRAAFLERLITPDLVRQRMRFWAMYDAIMTPAAEMRVFEHHPNWRSDPRQQMAAYKSSSGDFFFAWLSPHGSVIRGFAHEKRAPANIFDGLPPALSYVLDEPDFAQDEVTFAFWNTGRGWKASKTLTPAPTRDSDGAEALLGCLARSPERWRRRNYGTPKLKALSTLADEYAELSVDTVWALNPDADMRLVQEEADLLGWSARLIIEPSDNKRVSP